MQKLLRKMLLVLWILLCPVGAVWAEVNVSIGINIPIFPELVVVPGYPVYYAPRLPANYFFYDGLYWVFEDDNWYASSWYNGPWWVVEPDYVPLFILRIPVRYYRDPPPYFRGWHRHAPPRWDRHWGPSWESRRRGWDNWKRSAVPPRAPLPVYQRRYTGERYPRFEEQRELRSRHYKYEPRTRVVREIYREERRGRDGGPERRERGDRSYRGAPRERERDYQRPDGSERRDQRGPQRSEERKERGPRYEGQGQRPQERREYRNPGQGRGSEGRGGGRGEVRGGGQGGGPPEGRGGGQGGGPPEGRGGGQGGGQGGGRGGGKDK